jgi:exopolysaccharide production protein ExoY
MSIEALESAPRTGSGSARLRDWPGIAGAGVREYPRADALVDVNSPSFRWAPTARIAEVGDFGPSPGFWSPRLSLGVATLGGDSRIARRCGSTERARRVLDIAIALAAAIVFLSVILLICIGIKLQDGGPILFVQERIGRNGRPFRCLKFRSMVEDAEARLARVLAAHPERQAEWAAFRKLKDDPRITRFGEFLRRSSLDELPQLYNILKGDMSVVGPRPILANELPLYGRWMRYYISVKPGLTGLWQISGRNDVAFRTRVAFDRIYARTIGVKSYILILFATVPAVLARRGSY